MGSTSSDELWVRCAAARDCAASLAQRTDENISASVILVDAATEELLAARNTIRQLQAALQTNRQIGTAIGIVMARLGVDQDEAFRRLERVSQTTNRKLRAVAEEIVLTGHLPAA